MAVNGSSQTAFGLSITNMDKAEGDVPTRGRSITPEKGLYQHDMEVLSNEEGPDTQDLADEDVQNLIGVSISRAATKFLSPHTPAAEKAAAMEDLDGEGMFQSEGDITPPLKPIRAENPYQASDEPVITKSPPAGEVTLSFGQLPSPKPEIPEMPSPWVAEPQTFVVERPEASRSVLRDAFGTRKSRSFSGGTEALKKLLPSLPKAGSLIPNIPSPSFFSSSDDQKTRSRGFSLYKDFAPSWPSMSTSGLSSPSFINGGKSTERLAASVEKESLSKSSSNTQLPALRRVTSEDSVLYHTLSRASSLGDDTRFENHREMVNSRIKAIRDSLQDRSSFRLPSMPSMPRVPNFNFVTNLSFGRNSGVTFSNWKSDADLIEDITLGNAKKRLSITPNPAVAPGMVGAAVLIPEAAVESLKSIAEGPLDNALDRAIADLTGDIVIMGGYRGSILRSKKPPHRQLWVPVKVGLNIRKVNLEIGLNPEDEERMEEDIFASGMLQHIGPVDISRRLFKRLRESENARQGRLRIWDYGYDWRLSPHLLSRKFIEFLEGLPSNQPDVTEGQRGATVIAHSLGGLITRHAVNYRPELFSGVVYAGVPKSCVNILGPLRNGDAVMLSSRVLTAQVNFTLRTSFVLLPLDGYCFIDKTTKEEYPVDFFDVDDWIKYRWSPCTDPPLPPKVESTGGLANILKQGSSLTNLQLPGKRSSVTAPKKTVQAQTSSSPSPAVPSHESSQSDSNSPSLTARGADLIKEVEGSDRTLAPQMGSRSNPMKHGHSTNSSVSTTVTIPREEAISYLRRTLSETKQFKLELAHKSEYQRTNRYPPFAVIYGKSIPTVYGAKVDGRDGIACADAYDNLAFASGDGVCLSREAMLPEGYHVVKGGRISSDRGHVTLLGDLNAVGRALQAVMKGRAKRMGLGVSDKLEMQRGTGRV